MRKIELPSIESELWQLILFVEPMTPVGVVDNDIIQFESSPPPALGATAEEILRHYRAKEQLLVAKAEALLEKEKQLLMWEKELYAKQETLYWKERCMKHEIGDINGRKMEGDEQVEVPADQQQSLRDMVVKTSDVKGGQLVARQTICDSDGASSNGSSSSIAALLLASKVPALQSRPHAQSTLTVTHSGKVLPSPSVLMNAWSPGSGAMPPQPVNVVPPVRSVPSDDVTCSSRLAAREAAPVKLVNDSAAALRFSPQRVVLPLRVTPPISQHKSTRILPSAMNLRSVCFDAGSQTALEPLMQTGVASSDTPVRGIESRVLPRVSSTTTNHRPASSSHIPVHVVETGDTSDDQESPLREELSLADNAFEAAPAAANTLTTGRVNGSVDQTGQPMVSLEQIRLSTERIVKQFHRQNSSSNADVMKDGNLQQPHSLQLVVESDSNPEADSSSSADVVKAGGIPVHPSAEHRASSERNVDSNVVITKPSVNSMDIAYVESSVVRVTSSTCNLVPSSGLMNELNSSSVCRNTDRLSDKGSEQIAVREGALPAGGDGLETAKNMSDSMPLGSESGSYHIVESASCAVGDTCEKLNLAENDDEKFGKADNYAGAFNKRNERIIKRKLDNEVEKVDKSKMLRMV
jgi:hypothetical protein